MKLNTLIAGEFILLSFLTAAPLRAADAPIVLSSLRSTNTFVRIEGTSTIHDWQVLGNIIMGTMQVGPNFPLEPGQTVAPGKLDAQAQIGIPVTSLKSIEKDGKPYSDKMDSVMYEKLDLPKFARIFYHLEQLDLKQAPASKGGPYVCEAKGSLAVSGVTNIISMPVDVIPLGNKQVKVSGSVSLKMSDFKVEAPVLIGILTTGDKVTLKFGWQVGQKNAPK